MESNQTAWLETATNQQVLRIHVFLLWADNIQAVIRAISADHTPKGKDVLDRRLLFSNCAGRDTTADKQVVKAINHRVQHVFQAKLLKLTKIVLKSAEVS